jgi:hypothetical protein
MFRESRGQEARAFRNCEVRNPKRRKAPLWAPADVILSKRGIENLHGETLEADLSRPSVGTHGRDRGLRKKSRYESPSTLQDSKNRES